jgi:two-component system, sensor histidine kinase
MTRQISGGPSNFDSSHRGKPPFLVLIVEDNQVNQQILAHYLTNFGAGYEIVGNGLAAVEAVRTGRFSMVLMDIQMPIMDGVAATLAIRALPGPEAVIPIYAVTAYSGPEQDASYIKAGMNGVIAKPVPAAHLHRALNMAGQKATA